MKAKRGDLVTFDFEDMKMTGKVLIVNEHDSTCDLEAVDDKNDKYLVKHLPQSKMELCSQESIETYPHP